MAKEKVSPTDVFRTTDRENRHKGGSRGIGRHEILNPIPMQPPLGFKSTPSLADQIRQQVLAERIALENMEPETEEEADDFYIEDDPVIESRWENDTIPSIKEIRARQRQLELALEQAGAEAKPEPSSSTVKPSGDIAPEPAPLQSAPARGPA